MAEEAAQGRASQWASHGATNASARVLDERGAPAWLRAVGVAAARSRAGRGIPAGLQVLSLAPTVGTLAAIFFASGTLR